MPVQMNALTAEELAIARQLTIDLLEDCGLTLVGWSDRQLLECNLALPLDCRNNAATLTAWVLIWADERGLSTEREGEPFTLELLMAEDDSESAQPLDMGCSEDPQ